MCKNTNKGIVGITYAQAKQMVDEVVAGLLKIRLRRGDRVLLLSDASYHWLIVDLAIITAGAVSVPRGTDITDDELEYIAEHSEARYAIAQNRKTADRILKAKDKLPKLKYLIIMEDDKDQIYSGKNSLDSLIKKGQAALSTNPDILSLNMKKLDPADMSALIYTSGTTGTPKGVMLSQAAILSTVSMILQHTQLKEDGRCISLLPPWHVYERILEYLTIQTGITFMLTGILTLKKDLVEYKPTLFPSVPRIWESLYDGIMKKISKESSIKQFIFFFFLKVGSNWAFLKSVIYNYDSRITKRFWLHSILYKMVCLFIMAYLAPFKLLSNKVFAPIKAALGGELELSVSGGSALPSNVDKFLNAIGIPVQEGYGMTEAGGVTSTRNTEKPTPGTIGSGFPGVDFQLKDNDNQDVSNNPGMKGVLWIRTPQLFLGYYKQKHLSMSLFDADGFYCTGDIMMTNYRRELIFCGREKDTLVLLGGENIEPGPIEKKLIETDYISQAVVFGDERKTLGALIVPNFDLLEVKLPKWPYDKTKWNSDKEIRSFFRYEVKATISKDNGFKGFELVPPNAIHICYEPFDLNTQMTRTLKVKRNVVIDDFKAEIDAVYKS